MQLGLNLQIHCYDDDTKTVCGFRGRKKSASKKVFFDGNNTLVKKPLPKGLLATVRENWL